MVKFGPIEKLGTVWWFELFDLKKQDQEKFLDRINNLLEEFESTYSRFKETSVVSQLNKNNLVEKPSPEFLEILNLSKKFYVETDGVFNILVGDYLEMTGYDKDYNFSKEIKRLPEVPDLELSLNFDDEKINLNKNSKIDLGGIGKGFLIDKLAGIFKQEFALESFLINGGGDIYATEKDGEGFEIGLKSPTSDQMIGSITLKNQGFAASSPAIRSWKGSDGKTYSHIVGSDKPKDTFVVAPSATEADVWATTLCVNSEIDVPEGVFVKII